MLLSNSCTYTRQKCLSNGLLCLSQIDKREAVLSVALNHNLVGFITNCITQSTPSSGRMPIPTSVYINVSNMLKISSWISSFPVSGSDG